MDGFDLHQLNQELVALKGEGGRRAVALQNAKSTRLAAAREWEKRKAAVRRETVGTVQAKEDACTLDEQAAKLWAAYDLACVAEEYAKAMARECANEQSNVQTRAKLAVEAMRLAGIGGGP